MPTRQPSPVACCSRGIDMQLAKQAVEEAINLLRMAAKGADAWDVQWVPA